MEELNIIFIIFLLGFLYIQLWSIAKTLDLILTKLSKLDEYILLKNNKA